MLTTTDTCIDRSEQATALNGTAPTEAEIQALRLAALTVYQWGSTAEPPDTLDAVADRERWRFERGGEKHARHLLDPIDDGVRPSPQGDVLRELRRAAVGARLAGLPLSYDVDQAEDYAHGCVDQAVREIEIAASRPRIDWKAVEGGPSATDASEKRPLNIIKARPLAAMRANQPVAWIDGLLYPKTVTAVSSVGGTGKTTINTQILCEYSQDKPILGIEELRPRGKTRRSLYVNGEDHLATLDYLQAPVVTAHGLDALPFDLFPIQESEDGFVLTPANSRRLAEYVVDEGIEIVAFDPVVSLLPEGIKIIDPPAVRAWQRSTLGLVQKTGAAVLLYAHDNKAGQAFSGTVDFSNFARLALHFQAAGYTPEGDLLTLTTVKTNLSWRFSKLTLLRDPHTRCCRVTNIERMGQTGRGKVNDPAERKRILARIVRNTIVPLPSEQRTKVAVQALLADQTAEHGISRQEIRDFVTTCVTFDERKVGRVVQHIVNGIREEMIP